MKRPLSLAWRIGAIAAAGLLVSAGLAFAARSDDGGQATSELALELVPAQTEYETPTTVPPATPAPAAPAAPAAQDPTVAPVSSAEQGAVTPAAGAQAITPVAAPRPSPTTMPAPMPPTPPPAPEPVTDLPKYTDVAVLALAAAAILPSGMTFRECVELPPSHEKWPTPVHLYYEGKGRWLVETHISEVQVVFDEATATFRPRNFAPTNPACR